MVDQGNQGKITGYSKQLCEKPFFSTTNFKKSFFFTAARFSSNQLLVITSCKNYLALVTNIFRSLLCSQGLCGQTCMFLMLLNVKGKSKIAALFSISQECPVEEENY